MWALKTFELILEEVKKSFESFCVKVSTMKDNLEIKRRVALGLQIIPQFFLSQL